MENEIKIGNFLSRFQGVKTTGEKNGDTHYQALCPTHPDKKASLSITHCKNGNILIYCHAGCNFREVLAKVGLKARDLYVEEFSSNVTKPNAWQLVSEYHYTPTLKKIRWLLPDGGKSFTWQHKLNPTDSLWQKGTGGQPIPLYNQYALTTAKPDDIVYIVEGEKDVDTMTELGLIAVCSPHGATKGKPEGKWSQAYTDTLKGFNVAIIQDNDEVGKTYARTVARCLHGVAKNVKVIDLASRYKWLKEGGDVSDVVKTQGDLAQKDLDEITAMAPMAVMTAEDNPFDVGTANTEYTTYKGSSIISARDLLQAEFPPVKYLVEGMLAVGTSIFSAASKIGKSWLALDLGICVSTGDVFLDRQTEKCAVLYLALEDTYNRLQDRLTKVLNGKTVPEQFYFMTDVPNLDNGLLTVLGEYLQQYPDIKLIIVDTLQKIRGHGASNSSMYQQDYSEMGAIKKWADEKEVSFLLVHHNRKTEDKLDPYNMISGSVGIMGAADTIFVITKESRHDERATLHVIGRDVEQSRIMIQFNKSIYRWELVGDANILEAAQAKQEYDNSLIVKTIKALLDEAPDHQWSGTATKLLDEGKRITESFIATTAQKLAYELIKLNDQLYKHDKIRYEPKRNGNAGQTHTFSYEKAVDLQGGEDSEDKEDYSNLEW